MIEGEHLTGHQPAAEEAAGTETPHEQRTADAPARPAAGVRRQTLPNGMEVAYQSRAEVAFFYHDIFEKQIYLLHGVALRDGDCVFDIGANVGFFTLFAHRQARDIKVYAFEPAPPLFECLRINTSLHGVNARLFNCGLSREEKTAAFTYYPNSSGMSSFYADKREEKEALRAIMLNQLQRGVEGMERVMLHAEDLLEERLKSQTFECRLRTVSDIIAEEQVERIDFMKIDVQKSELDVLEGIRPGDWPKIRQVVIEVHDIGGRLREVQELLKARGYRVAVEQDDHYENSNTYNLFAVREESPTAPEPAGRAAHIARDSLKQIHDRARRQEEALSRRKQLLEQRKKGR